MNEFPRVDPWWAAIGATVAGFFIAIGAYFRPKPDAEAKLEADKTRRMAESALRRIEALEKDHVSKEDVRHVSEDVARRLNAVDDHVGRKMHRDAGEISGQLLDIHKRLAIVERDYVGLDRRMTEVVDIIKHFESKVERWFERHDDREQRGDRS